MVVGGSEPRSLIVTAGDITPAGAGHLVAPARPRAAIVVTGSELVRGERTDLNGPFFAAQALALGLEPARITIVGDRPDELEAALREGLAADLCLVSGGLGPTHDDRTVEFVAKAAGRPLVLDDALHAEIGAVSRAVAERLRRPYADFERGVRKQATLPEGAISLGLAGTAPGLVLDTGHGAAVVPARPARRAAAALAGGARGRAGPPRARRGRCRRAGACSASTARASRPSRRRSPTAGGDGDGVEATICARDFEIHVDLLFEPGAEDACRTRSSTPSPGRSSATCSPATSGRSRRSCSSSAGRGG